MLTNNEEQLPVWDYLFSPINKTFPKVPYIKQKVSLGPLGSQHLDGTRKTSRDGQYVYNQFGVTDKTPEVVDLRSVRSSDEKVTSGDEEQQQDVETGWSLSRSKQWIPLFPKRRASDVDQDVVEVNKDTNVDLVDDEKLPPIREGSGHDLDDVVVDQEVWRDSSPCDQKEFRNSATRIEFDNDDDEEDQEDDQDVDQDVDDESSHEGDVDVMSDDDCSSDDSVEIWPFSGENVLLKMSCVCVAIIFKVYILFSSSCC